MKRNADPLPHNRSGYKLSRLEQKLARAALEEAIAAPGRYDEATKASGHALPIRLDGGGIFYSKGWRSCEFTHAHQASDWNVPLEPFVVREADGRVRAG